MHDLPDAETLARGITAVLAGPGVSEPVRIETRTVNPYIPMARRSTGVHAGGGVPVTLGRAPKHRRTTRQARVEHGRGLMLAVVTCPGLARQRRTHLRAARRGAGGD